MLLKPPIDPTFRPNYPREITLRQAFRRSLLAAAASCQVMVLLGLGLALPLLPTRSDFARLAAEGLCVGVLIFPLGVWMFFQRYLVRAILIRGAERRRHKQR